MDPSTYPEYPQPERKLHKNWEYSSAPQHLNFYCKEVVMCLMADGTDEIMATQGDISATTSFSKPLDPLEVQEQILELGIPADQQKKVNLFNNLFLVVLLILGL